MKAMVLEKHQYITENASPLRMVDVPVPTLQNNEVLIKVSRCGVCHTELDEIEGRIQLNKFPIIPGHQVVGYVVETHKTANRFTLGDRVGVAWIFSSCGNCEYCNSGNDNLCPEFNATGKDADGGYAEYMKVNEKFAFKIPASFTNSEAAPLLCAGAIGYRSLRLTNLHEGQRLGLTGFGASAHLVLKMARYQYPNSPIYVFARSKEEQQFALDLGAQWVGDTENIAPQKMHAIIDTTPAWKPVVEALQNLLPGGRLVINAIRKEETDKNYLLHLDYVRHLWMEKEIKSVANVSRADIEGFLTLAGELKLKPIVEEYTLEDANKALIDLKAKNTKGAKVLVVQ